MTQAASDYHTYFDSLSDVDHSRKQAFARFEQQGLPNQKDEAWKYTSLTPVSANCFPHASSLKKITRPDYAIEATVLVFGNGHFMPEFSDPLPTGITIAPNTYDEDDFSALPLIALQDAMTQHELVIHVTAPLEKPILISYLEKADTDSACYHKVKISLDTHAQATLIEHYHSFATTDKNRRYVHHQNTRINVSPSAKLLHYIVQEQAKDCYHLAPIHATVGRESQYQQFILSTGAALARHEVHGNLTDTSANIDIRGIDLLEDNQHVDHYLPFTHATTHGFSNQHIRCVLDDQAESIFYGKVIVPEGAQKTEAHQLNKNLLLAKTAKAYSRPELEIFADDVICSHGSATGQIDEQAIFYLQSRGLDKNAARALLISGFIQEMVEEIDQTEIHAWINSKVEQWLEKGRGNI